eukprot:GFKZ01008821.1.p1 GENE.GFKZ01008821.1~~GFKZ01008821.1.p1  ORF type:complete len:501 (-),score=55.82 GFKZ01008821.1:871-2373(-)
MFIEMNDKWGGAYYSWTLNATNSRNLTHKVQSDVGSLLNPTIKITTVASSAFSTDLTSRDDVLLAFMSLWLLLIIEGVVTTVLLRRWKGKISNFGFSIRQLISFVQEMNWRQVVLGRATSRGHRRKINFKILTFALSVLLFTFGLEVAVLFLTEPELVEVKNDRVTFRLLQPVTPDWHDINFHFGRSIDLPCEAFALFNVEQAATRINGCVSSSVSGRPVVGFNLTDTVIDCEIVSDFHEYGAEHSVTIDGDTGMYSTRVYFTLGDERARVMLEGPMPRFQDQQVNTLHHQFVAYLFSIYSRETRHLDQERRVGVETINAVETRSFSREDGPRVRVVDLPDSEEEVPSRRFVTQFRGVIPRGTPALRLAQHFFRGAAAISVQNGDMTDFFIESGREEAEAVVWQETVRALNWLSLGIILIGSMIVLAVARQLLRPLTTSDIAGIYVKKAVGADEGRSPVELDWARERKAFLVEREPHGYMVGAETGDRWERLSSEYSDTA